MNWPVSDIIPQKHPFVFIDKVIEFTEIEISTQFEITEESPFVAHGKLHEAGLIENIAQTAAALEGCNAKQQNKEIKLGFIGSVKRLTIARAPLVGERVETKLKIVTTALGVNVAEGSVSIGDEQIASCTLNIFLNEN